jgi:hypothetical protein
MESVHLQPPRLDVANLLLEVLQLLLDEGVLLGHLLVLGLPLIAIGLEGLNLALEMACLDVGLAEPARRSQMSACRCRREGEREREREAKRAPGGFRRNK